MRKLHGHLNCDTCTAFKGLQRITVSKRGKQDWGGIEGELGRGALHDFVQDLTIQDVKSPLGSIVKSKMFGGMGWTYPPKWELDVSRLL